MYISYETISFYIILDSTYSYSIVCWLPPVIPETSQLPSGVNLAGISGSERRFQSGNHMKIIGTRGKIN